LGWMARQLVQHGELTVSDEVLAQLAAISTSTVQRLLDHIRQDERRLPQKGPERANQVLREGPMKRIAWDLQEPGHCETDLLHHGGRDARGEYVHTLQMIDVATGWSERGAVLGRSYNVRQAALRRGLARLPFAVLAIHPANGREFFNQHLVRFWHAVVSGAPLSRRRPCQKNDNRHVEQKNSSLVRAYLGFARLDSGGQTLALNELYDQMWLYYNLFQPVMHLVEKTLVVNAADDRPHVTRRHDAAQTPFDRVCATPASPPAAKNWPAFATPPLRAGCAWTSTTAWRGSGPCPAPRRGWWKTSTPSWRRSPNRRWPCCNGRARPPTGLWICRQLANDASCPHIHSPTTTTTTRPTPTALSSIRRHPNAHERRRQPLVTVSSDRTNARPVTSSFDLTRLPPPTRSTSAKIDAQPHRLPVVIAGSTPD